MIIYPNSCLVGIRCIVCSSTFLADELNCGIRANDRGEVRVPGIEDSLLGSCESTVDSGIACIRIHEVLCYVAGGGVWEQVGVAWVKHDTSDVVAIGLLGQYGK